MRDRGCAFPGCTQRHHTDGHHVEHWADGGETRLDNLVQLCRRHHRAVHEEGFRVRLLPNGEVRFHRPDGRAILPAPALPPIDADPSASLAERLAAEAIVVEAAAALPSWDGTPLDLAWAVDRLRPVGRTALPA